jgi:hypothetical protein
VIRYGRLRHHVTMNLRRRYEMTIRRCASMICHRSHRYCATPSPSMNREIRFAALADYCGAHCAVPAGCIWARSAARATNCLAVPWALRLADADPAEACCFRQSCPAMYGQRGLRLKFQDLNRDLRRSCDLGLSRGLHSNPGRRWMEISANRRFPACAKSGQRNGRKIASFRT